MKDSQSLYDKLWSDLSNGKPDIEANLQDCIVDGARLIARKAKEYGANKEEIRKTAMRLTRTLFWEYLWSELDRETGNED